MPDLAFEAPKGVALPVQGDTSLFPVRRVYCIGRNYAAHSLEMGYNPERESPFFFQKNPDNLDTSGTFPYPVKTENVHHEVELAVFLHRGGTNIAVDAALDHVFGYALALDMTRRDLQSEAKTTGRPWEIGKAFEQSAPVGPIHKAADIGHLSSGMISLSVNGVRRQEGDLSHMIWKTPEIISYLSAYFELAAGDVILTGTPAGVGPVEVGDEMELAIAGLGTHLVSVR